LVLHQPLVRALRYAGGSMGGWGVWGCKGVPPGCKVLGRGGGRKVFGGGVAGQRVGGGSGEVVQVQQMDRLQFRILTYPVAAPV
jgi:hypothetical protein